VLGFEATSFALVVYGRSRADFDPALPSAEREPLLCARGCEWRELGNGVCNPQCNTSACFWDRHDCAEGATGCRADCHADWIGDGYCNEACFNAN